MKKEIIAYINAENELGASVVSKAERYERNGLDALFIYNYSANDLERDEKAPRTEGCGPAAGADER